MAGFPVGAGLALGFGSAAAGFAEGVASSLLARERARLVEEMETKRLTTSALLNYGLQHPEAVQENPAYFNLLNTITPGLGSMWQDLAHQSAVAKAEEQRQFEQALTAPAAPGVSRELTRGPKGTTLRERFDPSKTPEAVAALERARTQAREETQEPFVTARMAFKEEQANLREARRLQERIQARQFRATEDEKRRLLQLGQALEAQITRLTAERSKRFFGRGDIDQRLNNLLAMRIRLGEMAQRLGLDPTTFATVGPASGAEDMGGPMMPGERPEVRQFLLQQPAALPPTAPPAAAPPPAPQVAPSRPARSRRASTAPEAVSLDREPTISAEAAQ
jgi:hypothetical protein